MGYGRIDQRERGAQVGTAPRILDLHLAQERLGKMSLGWPARRAMRLGLPVEVHRRIPLLLHPLRRPQA